MSARRSKPAKTPRAKQRKPKSKAKGAATARAPRKRRVTAATEADPTAEIEADDQLPPARDPYGPWAAMAIAALSGCLWFLACADFDIWPLAWIAMVPGLWVIERAPTRRRALLYGWLIGLVANVGGFYWITNLLVRFAHLPWVVGVLGLLLLCAYQGIVFLLFAWAVRSIRRISADRLGAPLPMALIAPVVMVAFEITVPFIFPWYLAITQAWVVPVIQIAELTGPVGVTALLLAVNGAIYDVATETDRRRRVIPAASAAAFVAVALVFGLVRIGQIDDRRAAAPGVMVGVVQGNIGFDEKGTRRFDLAAHQLRAQQDLSGELERGELPAIDRFGDPIDGSRGADLIVWTESSYPYPLPRTLTSPDGGSGDFRAGHSHQVKRGFSAPLIFGAITRDFSDLDDYPYNSALMLDADNKFVGRFDKIFLLMFGEYIPGLETFGFMENIVPKAASHFHRGEDMTVFPFRHADATWRLGPMICYEDILPDFGRKLSAKHPHLLVNITNDAWFGDTSEPWEHMALSVYRAVEARTDLVRAVNTGVSAFIDANGRVYAETYAMDPGTDDKGTCADESTCPGGYTCQSGTCRPRGPDAILGEAVLIGGADGGGHTFYARFGDVFGYGCVGGLLFMWIAWPRMRRRTA